MVVLNPGFFLTIKEFAVKNRIAALLLPVCLALALTTCFSPWAGDTATLIVSVGGAGNPRALVQPGDIPGFNFELIVKGPGGTHRHNFTGTTAAIKVLPGKYQVSIIATNNVGALRALGEREVTVRGGSTPVGIEMFSATEVTDIYDLMAEISFVNGGTRPEILVFKNGGSFTAPSQITINRPIEIRAENPVTINLGASPSFLFSVSPDGELTLKGHLTLDGGYDGYNTSNNASLIEVTGGTLTINNGVTLQNNYSGALGGAVWVRNNGTFTMEGGTICDNFTAQASGAVEIQNGTFTMKTGAVIANNKTNGDGGAVSLGNGTFNMLGGSIFNNTATGTFTNSLGYGGGVLVVFGTFNMTGGSISGNNAADRGGGVYVLNSGNFIKKGNSIIYGNNGGTNANTAGSGDGHAVLVYHSIEGNYKPKYRNDTSGAGDNISAVNNTFSGVWYP